MRVLALLVAAFLLAGCAMGGAKTTTITVTRTVTTEAAPNTQHPLAETESAKFFGTPTSVTKIDAKRYLIAIKPQFFLVGVTANVVFAAQQQNACQPLECPGVPDDRWVIPAGTQPVAFILPVKTKGTVITVGHQQMKDTTITATQLAALVNGAKTPKLIEPLDSGLWLHVDVDTVTSFVQQFQP